MTQRTIRFPGYEFALRRWLKAPYNSRSEAFWYFVRNHLRIRIGGWS